MKQKDAIGLTLLLLPVLFIAFHGGKKTRIPADFRDAGRERRACSRSAVTPADSAFYAASSPMSQGVFSCLSCHDGTIAPVDSSYAGYAGPAHEAAFASHPVGMDYMQVMRSRPDDYNDPATNSGIRLSDNKVTCLSCHDRDSAGNFKVAGSQTSLCLTCHKL
ncbi:MAG: cytochrome c3 family protein [Elusimicrobiota bacterium]